MSLFDILGVSVDDNGLAAVGNWLRDRYVKNADEMCRVSHARKLDEFYEGKGDCYVDEAINVLWTDPKNQERRRAVNKVGANKHNNILQRIAREKATVYSEPARRSVKADNERYQTFVDRVGMDGAMRELDRRLAFHEDALLWYRVRKTPIGDLEPLLEVVTPASFWAISHPRDRTLLVGIIFDQRMPLAKDSDPCYRVWTDDQTFVMNGKCEIFASSIESWPLGLMPGVLVSIRQPGTKTSLLAECPSADLLSAQLALRIQDLSLVKESISATKQTYLTGDTTSTPVGQTSDSEGEMVLGEGVTATSVDRGMELGQFRDNAAYVADSAGANHGVPPSLRTLQDAASGAEIEMRRIPIRELRKERIPIMRRAEARIHRVMSLVNSGRTAVLDDSGVATAQEIPGDLVDFRFSDDGFGVDFGEVQQPMTAQEQDQVYDERRRLNLTDPVDEEMRRNPDLKTEEDAWKVIDQRTQRNVRFVKSQKELMALNGSLNSPLGETTAQQNGKMGGQMSAMAAAAQDTAAKLGSELKQ